MTKPISIDINKILLDQENFRTGVQSSQKDAFAAILDEQGKDLVDIALHISENGLAPYRLPIVMPADEKGYYTVLDGNRRVSAISLVKNPALADGTAFARRFQELHDKYTNSILSSVDCILFPDRKTADPWIRVEHYKGQNGISLQEWGALARARADRMAGKPVIALDAFEFACGGSLLSEKARQVVSHPKRFNFSNLERLIDTPKVREALGLEIDDRTKKLKAHSNPAWLLKVLSRIIEIIATEEEVNGKKFSVDHIRSVAQQESFVKWVADGFGSRPRKMKAWRVNEEAGTDTKVESELPKVPQGKKQGKRPLPSYERQYVIPRHFSIKKITPAKLNDVFIELTKLRVQECPHATAVLLRTFIELATHGYIVKKGLKVKKDSSLNAKVQRVLDDLVEKEKLEDDIAKGIKSKLDKNPLGIIAELNHYVHSYAFMAEYKDVNKAWDSIEILIPHLFE